MKKISIFILTTLLALSMLLMFGCGTTTDNGENNTVTITKSYDYSFSIGEDTFKYVAEIATTGDMSNCTLYVHKNGTPYSQPILQDKTVDISGGEITLGEIKFSLTVEGKLVPEEFVLTGLATIIPPYELIAGTYSTPTFDETTEAVCTRTFTLLEDGTAVYSEEDIPLTYYPVGANKVVVVSDEFFGMAIELDLETSSYLFENTNSYLESAERVSDYYDLFFSAKRYTGTGYFHDCDLLVGDDTVAFNGYFFFISDYEAVSDGITVTMFDDTEKFVFTDNSFDLEIEKSFTDGDGNYINFYKGGYAYCSTSDLFGKHSVATISKENDDIIAVYAYESDMTYVFNEDLTLKALFYGNTYADMTKAIECNDVNTTDKLYFNEDYTKMYIKHPWGNDVEAIEIVEANKLRDNVIYANEYYYLSLGDNNYVSLYEESIFYDYAFGSESYTCTILTTDVSHTTRYAYNELIENYVQEDVCFVWLDNGEGDVVWYIISVTPYVIDYSEAHIEYATTFGNLTTDGEIFIIRDADSVKFINNYDYDISYSKVYDYGDGYITFSSPDGYNYLFDSESCEFFCCIKEEDYAGFAGKTLLTMAGAEPTLEHQIIYNEQAETIYVYCGRANDAIYAIAPAKIEESLYFDGIIKYTQEQSTLAIYVRGDEYYTAYEPNFQANEPEEKRTVTDVTYGDRCVDVSIAIIDGQALVALYTLTEYTEGPDSATYAYINIDEEIISGDYSYDEATNTVTVTGSEKIYTIVISDTGSVMTVTNVQTTPAAE